MLYLGIFRLDYFKKTIVRFKISTLEFVSLQFFAKKQKRSILRPKMPYLDVFRLKFLRKKAKMPKFGTKNALFGYFWAILVVLGNFKKLFSLGKPIDSY